MPETTPLIKAALNLRVGVGFDVYEDAESFLTAKRLEGRSPETHNHYRSAIKFLYKKVLKTVWDDDISRTNMTIHVRETKGRIDRYTILSQKNLDLLIEYWYD